MSKPDYASFDKEEHAILDQLVEDSEPGGVTNVAEPVVAATQPEAAQEPNPAAAEGSNVAPVAAEAPAAEPQPQPVTTEAQEPAQPKGDARAALRASRQAEKRLRDQLQTLKQENEALRQGKAPVETSISDAELAQLDQDFPVQAKIVRRQREIEQQIAQSKPAQPTEFEPISYDPDVQEVIDSVPELLGWQHDPAAQDKFARAIEYDAALGLDPDWRTKPLEERFAEATRRTKVALGITTPEPTAPAVKRTDPAQVIAALPLEGPKGISDFRGGSAPTAPTPSYRGMTDEQIMASLSPT